MKRLVQALVAAFGAAPIPDAWNLRGDIVAPDGTVPAVDPNPHPFWNTPARGATAGRQEYGGDKPGVPHNPEQPVIGQPPCGAGDQPRISSRASGQTSKDGERVHACRKALIEAIAAGEDPNDAAVRVSIEYPDSGMTLEQLQAGAKYAAAAHLRKRQDRADDIKAVEELIERLPRILAKLKGQA